MTDSVAVPAAPKRSRVVTIVLTVLLLGAAGTFGALYFVEKNRGADLSTQVEGKDRQIGDLSKQVKDAEVLTTDLSDQRRKLENDNKAMKPCNDAARALKAAAEAQDDQRGPATLVDMMSKC